MVTHPHYAVVFGPAALVRDLPEEQPQCPEDLESSTSGLARLSGLARFTLHWEHRPTWWKIPWGNLWAAGQSQEQIQSTIGCTHIWEFMDWPHLNKVVTKKTDLSKWQFGVHVVHFWINAKNKTSGKGARQRKKQAQKAKAQQERSGGWW